jgi:hypothetical protein
MTSRQIPRRMRNISNVVEKIKTHILRSVTFSPKIIPFVRLCGKCRIEEATYVSIGLNTAYALCMLDVGTHRLYNTYGLFLQQWLGERASMLRVCIYCLTDFSLYSMHCRVYLQRR